MNKFNVLIAVFAIYHFSISFVLAVPEPPCESASGPVLVDSASQVLGSSKSIIVGSNINGAPVLAASGLANNLVVSGSGHYGSIPAHKVVVHEQSRPLDVVAKGTKVEVSHPALTVNAKPVVVKRKPDVVVSPIFVHKQLPPVKVRQLYVKRVQPVENIIVSRGIANNLHGSGWLSSGLGAWNGVNLGAWNGGYLGAWNGVNLGAWNGGLLTAGKSIIAGGSVVTPDCADGN